MMLALLCSGQGRQDRRMFDVFTNMPMVAPILAETSALIGTNVRALLEEASDDDLHANRTSQILCVARGLAAATMIGPVPALVAGYSVGEISAWAVTGLWSPVQALRIVSARATLMDAESGPDDRLGFIRGLARQAVDGLVAEHGCAISIINPGQVFVIGGIRHQVEQCCAAALAAGATSARAIDVHVASHTRKLSGAVTPFFEILSAVPMARPVSGRMLIGAADATIVRGQNGLRPLAAQIDTAIDWAATLEALMERGATRVLELGPGSALADMVRATWPKIDARAIDDFRTIEGVKNWVSG